MRRQLITSYSFAFLQVVLVYGIPLSSCTVYRYLCGIFLDDISTREQFAFLVYCYRVKAIFRSMHCVLLASVWPNKYLPFLNLNWGWYAWSAQSSLNQWLPNGKLLLLSLAKCHGVPCSLPSTITTKVLKNCKSSKTAILFLQDPKTKMFETETKTKTSWSKTKTKIFIFVLEAPRDQDPGLEQYITALLTKLLPSPMRSCICLCLPVCLSVCLSVCPNEFLWLLEGWDVWLEPAD